MAAAIVNRVTAQLVSLCLPGASTVDLCTFGEQYLTEQVRRRLTYTHSPLVLITACVQLDAVYNKAQVEKGIAFPVCLSGMHIDHANP